MTRQMITGMLFENGYGSQPGAWRMPGVDPKNYTNFDSQVRYAQAAERGNPRDAELIDQGAETGRPAGLAEWHDSLAAFITTSNVADINLREARAPHA